MQSEPREQAANICPYLHQILIDYKIFLQAQTKWFDSIK